MPWFHIVSGLASIYPEPDNKRTLVEACIYNYNYDDALPASWEWPELPELKNAQIINICEEPSQVIVNRKS